MINISSKHQPHKHTQKQRGFTIIELLIATAVFSLIILMAAAGIIEITRMYYRGVVQARTQEAARTIIDEVSEAIRYGAEPVASLGTLMIGPDIDAADPDAGYFCLGSRRYTAAIDRQLVSDSPNAVKRQKRHVLWVEQPGGGCIAPPAGYLDGNPPSTNGRELLSENMRLSRFMITEIVPNTTYRVEVGVAYGDTTVLEPVGDFKQCKTGADRGTFCATSNLSVTVTKRLN